MRRQIAELLEIRNRRRRVDGALDDCARRGDERSASRFLVVQHAQLRAVGSVAAVRELNVRRALKEDLDRELGPVGKQNPLDATNESIHFGEGRQPEDPLQLVGREGELVLGDVGRSDQELRLHEELLAGAEEVSAFLLKRLADLLELVVVGASRDIEAFDQLENRLLEAAKRVGAQHAHLQRGVGQHRKQALVDENERSAVQSEQLEGMEGVEVNVKGEAANILQSAEQTVVVPNLRIQRGVVGGVKIEM